MESKSTLAVAGYVLLRPNGVTTNSAMIALPTDYRRRYGLNCGDSVYLTVDRSKLVVALKKKNGVESLEVGIRARLAIRIPPKFLAAVGLKIGEGVLLVEDGNNLVLHRPHVTKKMLYESKGGTGT